MKAKGATRFYVKPLAENDNSKNQVYLDTGTNFSSLNVLPVREIRLDTDNHRILKASLDFAWIDQDGSLSQAPGAQLILYPQYPEIRLSGFLRGCAQAPSELMTQRLRGRLLILGVSESGLVMAAVVAPTSTAAREYRELVGLRQVGVFFELPSGSRGLDSKAALISALRRIHRLGWVKSKRLRSDGTVCECPSPNCGGYTLEAELGIRPNATSAPDFLGWEIKGHTVSGFGRSEAGGPITLMTPEPTLGYYKTEGVAKFIRRFGYRDRSRPDRLNFGGRHIVNVACDRTRLTLTLVGFDARKSKIVDASGGVSLQTASGESAAFWRFADLMTLWTRKHAQAAYVPAMMRTTPERAYSFGRIVRVGEGTDFLRFLKAMSDGIVYYDPGIKMERQSTAAPFIKRRSQFRIASRQIPALYEKFEKVDVG
jgi:MvaI/BcnI restriction endonuclease family